MFGGAWAQTTDEQSAVGALSSSSLSSSNLKAQQTSQELNSIDATGVRRLPSLTGGDRNARITQSRISNPQLNPIPEEKGAFEVYVEKATGKGIDIFGKDLFNNVPDTFAAADAVQVNPDYLIGTGDELQIRGWGMVDIDVGVTVDRSGEIYIPRVGAVKVAGIKYRDLQEYLKKAVGKIYTNFDLTVSVAQTRAVQIYVVGHARRPGTYTVSAMSTLLNALFVSGGPDASGSMRNIQLKRGGNIITTFDLYDMLVKGDKSHDATLQDGDVIYIPEVGPLVALIGNVKKSAIFELQGEASLADAIAWAGGFDSAAEQKKVVVEKNVDNVFHMVAELTADKEEIASRLAGIPLNPTDILRVFSPSAIPVKVQVRSEYVRVEGEVRSSGVFQIKRGETLRELITRLGGPTEDGYIYATQLTRESLRVEQQARLDEIAERFEREVHSSTTAQISGALDSQSIEAANAEAARQLQLAQKLRSIKAKGRIVLEMPGGEATVEDLADIPLQDGDTIYIPRKPGTVDVLGAVFQQNSFIYRPNRFVNDYLGMAGGPTGHADKSEIYLIKADGTTQSARSSGLFHSFGNTRVNPGDTIVVPEAVAHRTWTQNLKDWTTILYQFGLGAAGLKVLQ
jgi:protein involved in polysaccharide export with SLBB domain